MASRHPTTTGADNILACPAKTEGLVRAGAHTPDLDPAGQDRKQTAVLLRAALVQTSEIESNGVGSDDGYPPMAARHLVRRISNGEFADTVKWQLGEGVQGVRQLEAVRRASSSSA